MGVSLCHRKPSRVILAGLKGRCAIATEITPEDIATAALKPKRVQGEAGEVEQRSILELIEAAKHVDTATGANTNKRGLRITQLLPPGAT